MKQDSQQSNSQEMVIFTRTYDFLTWLLPATNDFPRAHRHTVTRRLLDAAFDLRERLEEANLRQGAARLERLALADDALARVRVYVRGTGTRGHECPRYRTTPDQSGFSAPLMGRCGVVFSAPLMGRWDVAR